MSVNHNRQIGRKRRGAVTAFVLISMVALLGMVALAVDMGRLYMARGEMQVAADAAALAGAWELLDDSRMGGTSDLMSVFSAARGKSSYLAGLNPVKGAGLAIDFNTGNNPEGDLVLGHITSMYNTGTPLDLTDPTAGFLDEIVGFGTGGQGNAALMPLSLRDISWDDLRLANEVGDPSYADDYSYDPDTGVVSLGSDGVLELNIYPGAGAWQLPPGNFGTVDIGADDNSTADLSRQILHGITDEDFAHIGGDLSLADGPRLLNGDTGLSAAIKDELEAIIGLPRAIPVFDVVSGPGNNAEFRIVAFAGLRLMHVKLTGPMAHKQVIIQPAFVVDAGAIPGPAGTGKSDFVFYPVRIVR